MAFDEAILEELRQQTSWLRLLGLQALRPVLVDALKADKQRLAYQMSDGRHTTRQVSEAAGVGAATVSRWWGEWLAIGICIEHAGIPGRARHLVSLDQLG